MEIGLLAIVRPVILYCINIFAEALRLPFSSLTQLSAPLYSMSRPECPGSRVVHIRSNQGTALERFRSDPGEIQENTSNLHLDKGA